MPTKTYEVVIISSEEMVLSRDEIAERLSSGAREVRVVDRTPCDHDWTEWEMGSFSQSEYRRCKKCGERQVD